MHARMNAWMHECRQANDKANIGRYLCYYFQTNKQTMISFSNIHMSSPGMHRWTAKWQAKAGTNLLFYLFCVFIFLSCCGCCCCCFSSTFLSSAYHTFRILIYNDGEIVGLNSNMWDSSVGVEHTCRSHAHTQICQRTPNRPHLIKMKRICGFTFLQYDWQINILRQSYCKERNRDPDYEYRYLWDPLYEYLRVFTCTRNVVS